VRKPTTGPTLVAIVAILFAASGCHGKGAQTVKAVEQAIVDCAKPELAPTVGLAIAAVAMLAEGKLDVASIEAAAAALGKDTGGCLLAHIEAMLKPPPSFSGRHPIGAALDRHRERFGVADRYRLPDGSEH